MNHRNLDALIQAAREDAPKLDAGFERIAARHERRVTRSRLVRRAIAASSAVAVITVMLLRAGSSAADAHVEEVASTATADGDAGYAHD